MAFGSTRPCAAASPVSPLTPDVPDTNNADDGEPVATATLREAPVLQSTVAAKAAQRAEATDIGGRMWVVTANQTPVEQMWETQKDAAVRFQQEATIKLHKGQEMQAVFGGFQDHGVLKEDRSDDIRSLVDSFTAPALAAALRDRETTLQLCAHLAEKGQWDLAHKALKPFTKEYKLMDRGQGQPLDLSGGFRDEHMYSLKKYLSRMPRHLTKITDGRASVMIPLCNTDNVASILFTRRSDNLRRHKSEVCFPGGKVDVGVDLHIVNTAMREMGEEIGIQDPHVDVLGVLRCDWSEVASLVGVAVTPVVGFVGAISKEQLRPNPEEVSHCFTIPIRSLLDEKRWICEKYKAPVFVGGPYSIWGLTGYILHKFIDDVLRKLPLKFDS